MSPPGPPGPSLAYASAANPWFSWQYVHDNSAALLASLREHAVLTSESVVIAAAIAIPLAVLAFWYRRLTGPILSLSGVLYTIPSLALFAFLAPFTGIGTSTVIIGLVVYALLQIIRNTLAGLTQVPAEVREAAQGMGYGRVEQLLRVEMPLALPSVLTGLRLATVSTVALTTIGVLVGHGGLGQQIIHGYQAGYRAELTSATLITVALALVLDLFWIGAARVVAPWARRRAR